MAAVNKVGNLGKAALLQFQTLARQIHYIVMIRLQEYFLGMTELVS